MSSYYFYMIVQISFQIHCYYRDELILEWLVPKWNFSWYHVNERLSMESGWGCPGIKLDPVPCKHRPGKSKHLVWGTHLVWGLFRVPVQRPCGPGQDWRHHVHVDSNVRNSLQQQLFFDYILFTIEIVSQNVYRNIQYSTNVDIVNIWQVW